MKNRIERISCLVFVAAFFTLLGADAQERNIVFLHHSTGGLIYNNGHVADSIQAFNRKNGTDYSITERSFPDKPYPWANYPYDYWNIWIKGYCNEKKGSDGASNVACLEDLCAAYDVVILKHCFPGADILEDTGTPQISSARKSLENYKLQYRALRDKFQEFPENLFIVWTLVPRHRLDADSPQNAKRAKEFADWVKNEWLSENGRDYPNIRIFDYFSLAAEMDIHAAHPRVPYCLKYEYELAHDQEDSHPNQLASEEIGRAFSRFIIETISQK
ncbi:MAG: hypothetical protein AB2L20_01470 [Mangrovibacterium sp.]